MLVEDVRGIIAGQICEGSTTAATRNQWGRYEELMALSVTCLNVVDFWKVGGCPTARRERTIADQMYNELNVRVMPSRWRYAVKHLS